MLVTGGVSTDAKLKPSIAPDIVAVAFAFRNRPRNAAGSVAATLSPRPRRFCAFFPRHSIWKLTVAGNVTGTGRSTSSTSVRS